MAKPNVSTPVLIAILVASLVLSGCTPGPTTTPVRTNTVTVFATNTSIPMPTATASATPAPSPALTLKPGDFYFSLDGQPTFILSRNPTGKNRADFDTLLGWAHQGGTKVIRVHLTHGWWGDPWINKDWSVDGKWLQDWDQFFDQAKADGIYVIPVFGVWADWNNGHPDWGNALWQYNPLNVSNGGPVNQPGELFTPDSPAQKAWLQWVKTLVEHWQGRQNIAAWEIFSEINIASGASGTMDGKGGVDETTGVDFTNKAMAIIKSADAGHHLVTLSLAGVYPATDPWAEYYKLGSLDFIEIHPYSDKLDRELVSEVTQYRTSYQKPVMIGESGLWSMAHNANAHIGIEHAIWAGLVSGAMNGRALWENDGYAFYSISNHADAIAFMQSYAFVERPIADFTDGVDFSGLQPLKSISTAGVWGAAIGDEKMVLGWYRDAASEPPDWNTKALLSKQTVTIRVPGSAANWMVDFYDTTSGTRIIGSASVVRKGNTITIPLPDFTNDLAFKIVSQK